MAIFGGRRVLRWRVLLWAIGLCALAVVAILASLQTSAVRTALLRGVLRALESHTGFEARAEALEVAVLRREVRLRGFTLAPPHAEPLLRVEALRLSWPLLPIGDSLVPEEVFLEGVEVDLRRSPDGGWNLPRSGRAPSSGSAPTLPLRTSLRNVAVRVRDAGNRIAAEARGIVLEASGTRSETRGTLAVEEPVRWSAGSATGEVAFTRAAFTLGRTFTLEDWQARATEGTLRLRGTCADVFGAGRLAFDWSGDVDLARAAARVSRDLPIEGPLRLDGRITGTLAAPEAEMTWRGGIKRGASSPAEFEGRAKLGLTAVQVEEATLRVAGGSATARGVFVLEGAEQSHVEADWAGIDLGSLGASLGVGHRPPLRASVRGRLRAHWPEREWRRAEGEALMEASPGDAIASQLAVDGRARLELHSKRWTLEVDARSREVAELVGRLEGGLGERDLAATSLGGRLDLVLHDLDPIGRVFGAGPLAGRGEVAVVASGTLAAPEASVEARGVVARPGRGLTTQVTARAGISRNGVTVESVSLHAASAHVQGSGRIGFPGGVVDGRYELDLPDLGVLGPLAPAGLEPAGALHGRGLVTGAYSLPRITLSAAGTDLRLAGQAVRNARFDLRAQDGRIHADAVDLLQEGGRLRVEGTYDLRGHDVRFALHGRGFEIGALPAGLAGPGPLPMAGRIDVDLEASGPREMRADGRLTVHEAAWQGRSFGDVSLDLTSTTDGIRGQLEAHDLALRAEGVVSPDSPWNFTSTASLQGTDVGRWATALGQDALSVKGTATVTATASGSLEDLRAASVSLAVSDVTAQLRDRRIHLEREARLVWTPGEIQIEGLDVAVGDGRLRLDGAVDDRGGSSLRGSIEGRLAEVAYLVTPPQAPSDPGPALDGTAHVTFAISGPRERPRISAEANIEDGLLRLPGPGVPPIEGVRARATVEDGALKLEHLEATWSETRLTGSGDAPLSFLRPWLPAELGDSNPSAPRPAALRVRVEGSAGQILAPFLHGADSFGRTAVLTADLGAQDASLPSLRGEVHLEGADLRLSNVALSQAEPAILRIEGGRLQLSPAEWKGAQTDLRLAAQAQIGPPDDAIRGATLEAELSGDADLQLLSAFGRGVESGGIGSLRLVVKGPLSSPKAEGEMRLSAGTLRHRATRFALDGVTGTVRWNGTGFEIQGLEGSLNGGPFQASGALHLRATGPGWDGSIKIQARNAFLEWPRGLQARLRANLSLGPADDGLRLGGTVRILDGAYRTREFFSLQVLGLVERFSRGSSPSSFDSLGLDLGLKSADDVLLDAVDGRLSVGVDLRLSGSVGAPVVGGRLTAAPGGQVFMSGRTYDVDSAMLDFSRGSGLEPYVQAQARTRVAEYTILADVSGPATRAQTRFASTPPLGQSDVIALLTSGRTVGKGGTGAGRTDALSMASGEMLGKTGQKLGLDSLRIESSAEKQDLDFDPTLVSTDADPTSRLTFSKRLASTLSVTFSRSLTKTGSYTWFVAYKPRPKIELRVVQHDDLTRAFEFRHDVAFGGGQGAAPPPARRRRRRSGETVSAVRITGDEGAVRSSDLQLRQGQPFDYDRWLSDRDRIEERLGREGYAEARVLASRETPSVEEGAPRPRTVALVYEVHRGPRTSVAVRGAPDASTLGARIERAWRLGDYGASIEEEAVALARADLFARGFLRAQARARLTVSPSGDTKSLTVEVVPGEVVLTRRIDFEGNSRIPTPRLQALVQDPGRAAAAWLRPADLREAVSELYRSEGLLAAQVEDPRAVFTGHEARLVVRIDEGPVVPIADVTVRGADRLGAQTVLSAAALTRGQPFRPADVDKARSQVEAAYRRAGFNDAAVRIDGKLDSSAGTMKLEVSVKEGPREVLADLAIEGGSAGLQERVRPKLRLVPGEPVVLDEWTEARRRIYETGLFNHVDLVPTPAEPVATVRDGDRPINATLKLDEFPDLRLRYGLQLVTAGALASEEGRQNLQLGGVVEATRRTLFGRAAVLGASLQARKDEQEARTFLSVPRTLGTPVRSSLVFAATRETPASVEAAPGIRPNRTNELTWEERWRATRKLDIAGAYKLQWTRYDLERAVPGFAVSARLARVVGTTLFDARNDLIDTSRGSFSSASLEWGGEAIGSDYPLKRLLLQQFVYLPLRGLVFGLAGRAERAAGVGAAYLQDDRLQAGGANTVRGYPEDALGNPPIVNFLEGTTRLVVWNAELRFPIRGAVRGVLFGDAATLWTELGHETTHDSIWSTGLGLRYVTPVGILRLDYGIPLDEGFKPKRGRVYFSLGQVF